MDESRNPWAGKRVLITGVCGTVGGELLRQIMAAEPDEIIGLDNNESDLFMLQDELCCDARVQFYLCDIRERDRLRERMDGVDVVIHAAAYKHVILCEHAPWQAIQNNIIGTQNMIDAAVANQVERLLFCSTDKAVNPTSVMGTSKLMCERLITAADTQRRGNGPVLACCRFGNVLGSRGSVIPAFTAQIARGGPVTLTDPRMTRFIMTLSQAVTLVLDAVFMAHGGEVFVTKIPVIRIEDLVVVMIEEMAPRFGYSPAQIKLEIVGSKAGEKLYEELVNEEETRRALELAQHFVVLPAIVGAYDAAATKYSSTNTVGLDEPYNSASGVPMTIEELRQFLLANELLTGNGSA